MNHACYPPAEELRDDVFCYLISESTVTFDEWQESTIMPNGLTALVFSYGTPFEYVTGLDKVGKIADVTILGPHTKPCTNRWRHPISLFAVVFKPLGLYKLLNGNMGELKNDIIDLADYPFPNASWVSEKLAAATTMVSKVNVVEGWLKKHLALSCHKRTLTSYILKHFIDCSGKLCIETVLKKMNINRRYLERLFNHQLGMSPKEYAETIRFSYIASELSKTKNMLSQEMTYLGDFHDQSHLIKHFKKHSNLSPGKFHEIITKSHQTRFASRMNIYKAIHGGPDVRQQFVIAEKL